MGNTGLRVRPKPFTDPTWSGHIDAIQKQAVGTKKHALAVADPPGRRLNRCNQLGRNTRQQRQSLHRRRRHVGGVEEARHFEGGTRFDNKDWEKLSAS